MKQFYLMLFFITIKPLSSYSQSILIIEIQNLRNNKGEILVELTNESGVRIKEITQVIVDKKCIIQIENIKPGRYALKYFHDENKNKKLDVNRFGIPIEGYGFSNNAKGTFGPPPFEKTIFELKRNTTLLCTPTYY